MSGWYNYDPATHAVSPKEIIYLVRTGTGDYAKVQVLDYADGVVKLRVGPVTREVEVISSEFDASDAESFVYIRFDQGLVVSPEEPTTDTGWDLAISRTKLKTNSGTSGLGVGGALDVGAASLEEIGSVPGGFGCYLAAEGHICDCELTEDACAAKPGAWTEQCGCPVSFAVDEMLPLPGPPGAGEFSGNPALAQWYDYDPVTHSTTPKPSAFVVRAGDGAYAKIQIMTYDDGVMSIDWAYAGPESSAF